MEEGLFYSEEALINRVIFLSDSNEINIIVEDEYKEYEYENILNRLFSYQLILNNIFPMKGKPGVKKAFEEYGAFYDGKPTIYLVDGDFDIIMNKDMVEHPNYIYLDKYKNRICLFSIPKAFNSPTSLLSCSTPRAVIKRIQRREINNTPIPTSKITKIIIAEQLLTRLEPTKKDILHPKKPH